MTKFEGFVRTYAKAHDITEKEALTHAQVKATKEYYEKAGIIDKQINEEFEAEDAKIKERINAD